MTHKIIKTDHHLFAIGDNYKSDKFPYLVVEKLTTGEYNLWQVDNPNDWDEKTQYQILAQLPLNGAPYLDGVPLLPPYSRHQEDGLNDAVMRFKESYSKLGVTDFELSAFSVRYLQAREKYKYTEEHVFGFLTYYNSINFNKPEYRYKHLTMDGSEREYNRSIDRKILAEYIQSLQQPKYPIAFECEVEPKFKHIGSTKEVKGSGSRIKNKHAGNPKTFINSEGRTEWVGKWIFEQPKPNV
jgi:hypothetical protein